MLKPTSGQAGSGKQFHLTSKPGQAAAASPNSFSGVSVESRAFRRIPDSTSTKTKPTLERTLRHSAHLARCVRLSQCGPQLHAFTALGMKVLGQRCLDTHCIPSAQHRAGHTALDKKSFTWLCPLAHGKMRKNRGYAIPPSQKAKVTQTLLCYSDFTLRSGGDSCILNPQSLF